MYESSPSYRFLPCSVRLELCSEYFRYHTSEGSRVDFRVNKKIVPTPITMNSFHILIKKSEYYVIVISENIIGVKIV
jgi:hypothetical protein